MSDLSYDERIRIASLEAASRVADPGTPTSGLLSRASQCETYIRTGLIRTGPKWLAGAEVGVERVSVMVEGPELDPADVEAVAKAVRSVL
jgi:hypothetical protein